MIPEISIIIPVYNAQHYILKCLQSIAVQTISNFEVLIINDGSTDQTELICTDFIANKPNFKLYSQINTGVSEARNFGIERAIGSFLTFIDADDYVTPNFLEKLYGPFQNDSLVALSCGGYYELSKNAKDGIALHDFTPLLAKNYITRVEFYQFLFQGVTGVLWGKMFLAKIIKKHAIKLHPKIKLSEDFVFVFEYVSHIEKIALIETSLYYYNRLHESGLSGHLSMLNLTDFQLVKEVLLELIKKNKLFQLEDAVKIKFSLGVLSIANSISTDAKSTYRRIKDLKSLLSATDSLFYQQSSLNRENRLQMMLFTSGSFFSLVALNTALKFLRRIKN